MNTKTINPALGADSFNCPSCGALAHQNWFLVHGENFKKDNRPSIPDAEALARVRAHKDLEQEVKNRIADYFEQRLLKLPFFDRQDQGTYVVLTLENVYVSQCYSCHALAVWAYDRILFPPTAFNVEPNIDLADDIKLDFCEAAKILDLSPRGAAALLRLSVQKLCIQLGEAGKNIDTDIANLVKKGLETSLQQALDIVRVIGNEAVHPGQIDLRDDRETATKLFQLINIIADAMISRPKQIAELYGKLPESKLRAIEKRDSPKEAK
jgi:Domain of unknown function (DUF4145)